MDITYHKEVSKPESLESTIPHSILNEEIQGFIKDRIGIPQIDYYCDFNGHFTFIYLDNGDRIDVAL